MKQKLYLIRHGHTQGTDNELMYGATELPVTDDGLREIADLAAAGVYPDPEGAELYTSGMLRTEQTLRSMYGEAEHRVAPLLREINLGQFEMMSVSEILEDDYGRAWLMGELDDPAFEGGDSFSGFMQRTSRGLRELIDDCLERGVERMIVVIHGGVITSVMNWLFPDEYDNMWDWSPVPGHGFEVELVDGQPAAWSAVGEPGLCNVPMYRGEDE